MSTSAVPFDPAVLGSRAFQLDPYPTYRYLRDHHPVYRAPGGTWLITRYDDVVEGFRDHERLSSRIMEQSHSVVFGPALTAMDGDEHTQKRNIVAPEFVGKKLDAFMPVIEQNVRALIGNIVDRATRDLISGFHATGEVDLVDQFTTRLPANVIIDMLGLPKSDHNFFHDCYTKFMAGLGADPVRRQVAVEANARFHAYIDPYVTERMATPGEDLISRLCAAEVDGQKMSAYDIKSFASLLLTAGGETTDKAIANLWWLLLNHPDQFDEVKRDSSLIDRAFTETMRHSGPVPGEPREALAPIELHGEVIPAGASVNLSMHSANHDDRVFSEPERFNIFREDLYFGRDNRVGYQENGRTSHIGFGMGKHFCLGYQLARTEAVMGTKLLLEAIENPRIKDGQNPVMGEGMAMRSVKRLPLTFHPR